MNRWRRWSALAGLTLLAGLLSTLRGEGPAPEKKDEAKPAEKWLVDRALTLTPAPAPVPVLKYRLFPAAWERKEGNAVPIYLRFAHERSDARKKLLREKPEEWNKLPLAQLPLAEIKAFLEEYKYNFQQLDLGARRKTAEWNYTLDAGNPIGLLLPDVQEMRMQAPLLVLKARVEMAERRYADAVRTLETGFSFSEQVGDGQFLIQSLVGIACASQFADCLLDLAERPDAPNLYWALAVLPRPLIDMRGADEWEQKMIELQLPDLADLDRPRPAEEWDAALVRVRKEVERITRGAPGEGGEGGAKPPAFARPPDEPAAKSPDLPAARKYLTDVAGMPAAGVEAMPPAQVLLLYLWNYFHELRDETFRATYLPFPEARPLSLAMVERLKALPDTEAARLVRIFLPAIPRVRLAQVRLERRLAAHRAIEALRMHAAREGRLPDRLDQVTVVPVPDDPGTGRPFEYGRDGETATLGSRILGEPLETTGLRYRVTLRK
jgi:hypothetical protein